MSEATLLARSRFDIKLDSYLVGPATALSDSSLLTVTQDYRRRTSSRMMPLSFSNIESRIPGGFTVLVFRHGEAFTINPGGTVRTGLPFMDETVQLLRAGGIESAIIAGESFVQSASGSRTRVHDVSHISRAPQSEDDLRSLGFAPFDLISVDGTDSAERYADNFKIIVTLFSKGTSCPSVETHIVARPQEIQEL